MRQPVRPNTHREERHFQAETAQDVEPGRSLSAEMIDGECRPGAEPDTKAGDLRLE